MPCGGGGEMVHDPRVLGNVGQLHASRLVLHQQPGDEVSGPRGYRVGEPQIHVADTSVGGPVPLCLEWWVANEELIREHSQTPHISRGVVLTAFHHLRGQIIQRTAEGGASGGWRVHRPTEIGNFDVTSLTH